MYVYQRMGLSKVLSDSSNKFLYFDKGYTIRRLGMGLMRAHHAFICPRLRVMFIHLRPFIRGVSRTSHSSVIFRLVMMEYFTTHQGTACL